MSGKGSGFSIPGKKKTPYQLHKEKEEERKKREEEAAAAVYDDFVDSFKAEEEKAAETGGVKTFIRGGTVMPGQRPEAAGASAASSGKKGPGGKYTPSFIPPSMLPTSKPKAFDDDDEEEEPKKSEKDKPKAIDTMLEKIKKEQEARDERMKQLREGQITVDDLPREDAFGATMRGGSFDDGDPYTTNVYLANIAPDVDELMLMREFGRFGPIASVKVMWPRSEEQRKALRNCGFVSFMKRKDAEDALMSLNGLLLNDYEMRIGWGKAVPIPPIPVYPPNGNSAAAVAAAAQVPTRMTNIRTKPEPPWIGGSCIGVIGGGGGGGGGGGFSSAGAGGVFGGGSGAGRGGSGGGGGAGDSLPWSTGTERSREAHQGTGTDIEVRIPTDLRLRYVIDTLAVYVSKDGCEFEQSIMELEHKSPEYAFLYDLASPEHMYYRWRLYSLCEGDTLQRWRLDPFVMVAGGQRWVPPTMSTGSVPVATAAQRGGQGVERERPLSELERDKYEDLLRKLTVEREHIRDAMVFALDHADASGEVVNILYEALTLEETPIPLKIARLFLVNDILYNSTAPVRNASRYRSKLETILPTIFESLQETYRAVDTRITQEALRRHVLRVLRAWRERYMFSDDYLNGLQATFLHASMLPAAIGTPAASTPAEDGDTAALPQQPTAPVASGRPELRQQLEEVSQEDLERRCRINGLSNKGGQPAMIARLLALDAYLNGTGDAATVSAPSGGGGGFAVPPAPSGVFAISGDSAAASTANAGGASLPMNSSNEGSAAAAGETAPLSAAVAAAGISVVPPAVVIPAAVAQSRWTSIEEEEEDNKAALQIPVSAWLKQEQEEELRLQKAAEAKAAAAVLAAAAAESAKRRASGNIFGDDDDDDDERPSVKRTASSWSAGGSDVLPGGAAGFASTTAADEEKRKRMREIELSCARYEAELEDQGLGGDKVAAKVTERRVELLADLERVGSGTTAGSKDAALERWRSRREARVGSGDDDGGSLKLDRDEREKEAGLEGKERSRVDRSRSRSRDREKKERRNREGERERDRVDKDRDEAKGRERERERDGKERDSRGRSRSRSRDRNRSKRDTRSRSPDHHSRRDRSKSPSRHRSRSPKKGRR